jgi:DNA modification methylase
MSRGGPIGRGATGRPERRGGRPAGPKKPPLSIMTTTLWEYPSQHYGDAIQGDKNYTGATPSWVIWQLLQRYTKPKQLVVDPMCGSGTTIDVARDLGRKALGYDVATHKRRSDIFNADARKLPLEDGKADFVFVDPPYSTHIDYSDDPRCIGKLDAGGDDGGAAYYDAMRAVIAEIDRVLKPDRHMALYVSDSFRKGKPFMPIGFELFAMLREHFEAVDIIAVVRHNEKLQRGNFRKAAEEENFFLRGFNYLFIMHKPAPGKQPAARPQRERRAPERPGKAPTNTGRTAGRTTGRRAGGPPGAGGKKRPPRRPD